MQTFKWTRNIRLFCSKLNNNCTVIMNWHWNWDVQMDLACAILFRWFFKFWVQIQKLHLCNSGMNTKLDKWKASLYHICLFAFSVRLYVHMVKSLYMRSICIMTSIIFRKVSIKCEFEKIKMEYQAKRKTHWVNVLTFDSIEKRNKCLFSLWKAVKYHKIC